MLPKVGMPRLIYDPNSLKRGSIVRRSRNSMGAVCWYQMMTLLGVLPLLYQALPSSGCIVLRFCQIPTLNSLRE